MKFRFSFLILFLLLVNCSYAQSTQESMLSSVDYVFLDKLIAMAKMNYPKMKVSQARVNIAKLNVQKAKMDWLGIFTFTYLYSPAGATSIVASNNSYLLNGYQLGVGTSLGAIIERPTMIKSAKKEYEIAELNLDEYNLSIEATVKQRYYAYIQLQTTLGWRMKVLEGAENTMNTIKLKFEKGVETFDSYNRSQTAYASSVQTKIETEGALLLAKSNLEEIIGAKLESIK